MIKIFYKFLNFLKYFRVRDLTGLLDKDKDYLNKYKESLELMEMKKKEFEEIRLKMNQDLDERKLKITQLNIEKHEHNLEVKMKF